MNTTNNSAVPSKSAYVSEAEHKLADLKGRLDSVKENAMSSLASGQVDASERLQKAIYQADKSLLIVQARIDRLKEFGQDEESREDGWAELRNDVEDAWEDLSQSVKKLVGRFH